MNHKLSTNRLAAIGVILLIALLAMLYVDQRSANAGTAEQSTSADTTKAYMPITFLCKGSPDPLSNGDFESGHTDWYEYTDGDSPWTIIRDDAAEMGITPHSGDWVAWIYSGWAVSGGTQSYISQEFTVPGCSPYLVIWYWSLAADTWCPGRCFTAKISVDGLEVGGIYMDGDSTKWNKAVVNLSQYRNQSVELAILVPSNSYSHPTLVVDDLEFVNAP